MKKKPLNLEISKTLFNRIVEHAQREYPLECCGILAGKEGKIARLYSVKNQEKSQSSYLMHPEEQFRVFRKIEEEGLELSAIYHSHPQSPAYPSPRDIDQAFYPDSQIWIISLMDRQVPEIGAFRIKKGKVHRRKIRVQRMPRLPEGESEY